MPDRIETLRLTLRNNAAASQPLEVPLVGWPLRYPILEKAMMNALLALSDADLDREKPNALRLYPSHGASDADGIEIFGLRLTS